MSGSTTKKQAKAASSKQVETIATLSSKEPKTEQHLSKQHANPSTEKQVQDTQTAKPGISKQRESKPSVGKKRKQAEPKSNPQASGSRDKGIGDNASEPNKKKKPSSKSDQRKAGAEKEARPTASAFDQPQRMVPAQSDYAFLPPLPFPMSGPTSTMWPSAAGDGCSNPMMPNINSLYVMGPGNRLIPYRLWPLVVSGQSIDGIGGPGPSQPSPNPANSFGPTVAPSIMPFQGILTGSLGTPAPGSVDPAAGSSAAPIPLKDLLDLAKQKETFLQNDVAQLNTLRKKVDPGLMSVVEAELYHMAQTAPNSTIVYPTDDTDLNLLLYQLKGNVSEELKESMNTILVELRQAHDKQAEILRLELQRQSSFRYVAAQEVQYRNNKMTKVFLEARDELLAKFKQAIITRRRAVESNIGEAKKVKSAFTGERLFILRKWFLDNILSPYPSKEAKLELAEQTGLTETQVNHWLINTRVRVWRPMVQMVRKDEVKETPFASASAFEYLPPASIPSGMLQLAAIANVEKRSLAQDDADAVGIVPPRKPRSKSKGKDNIKAKDDKKDTGKDHDNARAGPSNAPVTTDSASTESSASGLESPVCTKKEESSVAASLLNVSSSPGQSDKTEKSQPKETCPDKPALTLIQETSHGPGSDQPQGGGHGTRAKVKKSHQT